MSNSSNHEQLQVQVIEYLYGDLDARQRADFEAAAAADPVLQEVLEQEQRLNSALPPGLQPAIDEERMQGNRWLLRQRLQREARAGLSLRQWWQELRQRPLTLVFQGAAMAMTFLLGLFVANPGAGPVSAPMTMPQVVAAGGPLSLIQDDDYQINQLRVNSYDASSGQIDLSFALSSETRLTGNVSDQTIFGLMAVALQEDIDSAARLDTINALQPVRSGDEVYQALIHVLHNDDNPGVRYQAVTALVDLAHEDRVRSALLQALQQDSNPGVRVEAFNALMEYQEPEVLEVFRQQMDRDSNEYIRTQARSIVEGGASSDLL